MPHSKQRSCPGICPGSRPLIRGQGRLDPSLGPSDLVVSSCSPPHQDLGEGQEGRDNGYPDLSNVDLCPVVAAGGGDAGRESSSSATLPAGPESPRRGGSSAVLEAPRGMQNFQQQYQLSHQTQGLSEDDLAFLANHLAPGTSVTYGYTFKSFRGFCDSLGTDPLTCSPVVVVKYLRGLYEKGAQYSTINGHRSAISKFHCGVAGVPIGEHPLVGQAVRAAFRLRPPLPRYTSTFDICPVLRYISELEPLDQISLKMLTFKTVFIISFSSLSRLG